MVEMDAFEQRLATTLLEYADEVRPEIDAAAVAHRVVAERPRRRADTLPWRSIAWRPTLITRGAWVLIVAAGLLGAIAGGLFVAGTQPTVMPPEGSATPTPAATPTGSIAPAITSPPVGAWSPILIEKRAATPPSAATCPPGTDPDLPGPAGQERPDPRRTSNMAAAFDRHAGRIVFVDRLAETWTYDVCTNTWHRMHPEGIPTTVVYNDGEPEMDLGWLVYDVDSDRTVAFGWERLSVYDANANAWTSHDRTIGEEAYPEGVVYDPVSGLILAVMRPAGSPDRTELRAYDVDADTWTTVGVLADTATGFLYGYVPRLDRLVLGSYDSTAALVDPRTGSSTILGEPAPGVVGGFGSAVYGHDAETVYVFSGSVIAGGDPVNPGRICRFDPETVIWTDCFDPPSAKYLAYGAMIGDPINERLLLVHGIHGDWWRGADDGVWAIDAESGTTTELLSSR